MCIFLLVRREARASQLPPTDFRIIPTTLPVRLVLHPDGSESRGAGLRNHASLLPSGGIVAACAAARGDRASGRGATGGHGMTAMAVAMAVVVAAMAKVVAVATAVAVVGADSNDLMALPIACCSHRRWWRVIPVALGRLFPHVLRHLDVVELSATVMRAAVDFLITWHVGGRGRLRRQLIQPKEPAARVGGARPPAAIVAQTSPANYLQQKRPQQRRRMRRRRRRRMRRRMRGRALGHQDGALPCQVACGSLPSPPPLRRPVHLFLAYYM